MARALLPILLLLLVVAAAAPRAAEGEPPLPLDSLFAPPTEDSAPLIAAPSAAAPSAVAPSASLSSSPPSRSLVAAIQDQQRSLYQGLAAALRAVKAEHSAAAVAGLVVLSFLYGIFHAAGPGHGKAVISAYLLANERAVRRGIGLSFAAALAQAATAILLVTAILFALQGAGIATRDSLDTMAAISATMIVAIGAWMLVASLRGLVRDARAHAPAPPQGGSTHAPAPPQGGSTHDHPAPPQGGSTHDHPAPPQGGCGHHHHVAPPSGPGRVGWLGTGAIVAAIGIRPCSGAIFVLLFANTIGLYAAGVVSTLAMALGTAITVSALAVLTLWSKRAALRLAGVRAGWLARIYRAFGVLGAVAILGLGLLLLLATTAPESPFPA